MKTDVSHKEFQICNNNFTTDINEPRKQLEKVKCQKQNIGKKKTTKDKIHRSCIYAIQQSFKKWYKLTK